MDDQTTREAAADLIDGAIDALREQGWCQGVLQNDAGQVCMEGAIDVARFERGLTLSSRPAVTAHRALAHECGEVRIHRFNDRADTTAEDAFLTMKRAAASLRDGAL